MLQSIRRRSLCVALAAGGVLPTRARSQAQAPLEIGVLPNISARVLLTQYQPLRDFLARRLQRPVQVSTALSWNVFHQRTLALEYDLVVTAANLARLAQIDSGCTPLVSYAPSIKGLLVCARARPIQSAAELRGQTLALSNPQSLISLRGLQWLAEQGLQRERDFKTIKTPTDDSVGNVVMRGDALAAMCSGGEYRAMPEALMAQLQLVSTFAEVPGFVVVASPRLSPAQRQAIQAQLLHFASASDEGRAFFASTGFTGMREPAPGLMESMDPYLESTRQVMSAPG
jgi:phosphonate transport system substrate-binding protein